MIFEEEVVEIGTFPCFLPHVSASQRYRLLLMRAYYFSSLYCRLSILYHIKFPF